MIGDVSAFPMNNNLDSFNEAMKMINYGFNTEVKPTHICIYTDIKHANPYSNARVNTICVLVL